MAIEVFLQQAITFHNQGKLDEAQNLYQKALSLAPNNDTILNLLGLVAQAKQNDALAVEYFYKALSLNPFSQEYNFSLAYSLDNLEKYQEAITAYQKATGIKEALNNIANIYKKLNNKKKAIEYYLKAISLDNTYQEPHINLAFLDLDITTLLQYQDNDLAKYYLALINFEKEEHDIAMSYLKSINEHTDYTKALKAEIYFYKKDYQKAKHCFYKAQELNPKNYKNHLFLGDLYTMDKNFSTAEKHYQKAIELAPNDLNIKINYANMLYLSGNSVQSLEEYRKIIAKNPTLPEPSNNIGIILKDQEQYLEALELFFNALALNNNFNEASINILETLIIYHKTNPQEAKKIAQNWLSSYPENAYAKHLTARFENKTSTNDAEFNQKLFDAFSTNYEDTLKNINYNLPQITKTLFQNISGKVLDLGCGSGLLGEVIKNNTNTITGVDISQNMLELAKQKNIYDELILSNIENYLNVFNDFDYIFALDVFCYISDLSNIINHIKNKKFLFSIELGDDKDYSIQTNGRYKHSKQYIKSLLTGIDYQTKEATLRTEDGEKVKGLLFIKRV